MTELLPSEDPNHEGNSAKYHTGEPCITGGCCNPAGTWWSPLWCMEHNAERLKRITAGINDAIARAMLPAAVDAATADLRRTMERLVRQRDEAAAISWKPITEHIKDRDVLLTVGSGWIVNKGHWRDAHKQRHSDQLTTAGWFTDGGSLIAQQPNFYAEIPSAPTRPMEDAQ